MTLDTRGPLERVSRKKHEGAAHHELDIDEMILRDKREQRMAAALEPKGQSRPSQVANF